MNISSKELNVLYNKSHDLMRNIDGLHPQEAFDELLKYLFFKINNEIQGEKFVINKSLFPNGTFKIKEYEEAKKINSLFSGYLKKANIWSKHLWHNKKFYLSNHALVAIHNIFRETEFNKLDIDIKSTALRSFLSPELRKGLGIFLTPDDVVKAMIKFVKPKIGQKVLDPACGSGTFLIEQIKLWNSSIHEDLKLEIWGNDKNPRMILISELNLGYRSNCIFNKTLDDFLFPSNAKLEDWFKPNTFDYIFTNPPFGVMLDNDQFNLSSFATCFHSNGTVKKRQNSEIVFIEQCLKFLKPGGTLAIITPKSIITNATFKEGRNALNKLGYAYAITFLPPETFQIAGTQTTTIILFMKKYRIDEDVSSKIKIGFANISNVGYDSTGRERSGNQLIDLATNLQHTIKKMQSIDQCKLLKTVRKDCSLSLLNNLILERSEKAILKTKSDKKLGDIAHYIGIGVTPARNQYVPEGLFILKVGNLTGGGIDWYPRDRNFVNSVEKDRRIKSIKPLILKENDIVLTSSAHTPKYIAQKVDIITKISEFIGGEGTYVGELMLVRPDTSKVDPYLLLAYLRSKEAKNMIQNMIRGQTAHLHSTDIMNLPIPNSVLSPNSELMRLKEVIAEELKYSELKNNAFFRRNKLLESIEF